MTASTGLRPRRIGTLLLVASAGGVVVGALIVVIVGLATVRDTAFDPSIVLFAIVVGSVVGLVVGLATITAGLLGVAVASVFTQNVLVGSITAAALAAAFGGLVMGFFLGPGLYWDPLVSGALAAIGSGLAVGTSVYVAHRLAPARLTVSRH